jgi:cobalt-zinc-cadmium efflux system outer membrane protein
MSVVIGIAGQCGETPNPGGLPKGTFSTLTLHDAIQVAMEHTPRLRAYQGRIQAASGRARQAGPWSNPELELAVEDWPVSKGSGFSDAKQTLGISQTLPFPGKKPLDKQIGGAGVKLSEAELALRRTELIRDVKASFFRVLTSERLVRVSAQLVAVAESSATTARKRVEAGATPYQEQLRAEIQLEQARAALIEVRRDQMRERQNFAGLLGRPDMKETPLQGSLVETPSVEMLEATASAALARHPSLGGAQANLTRSELEARRSRLEPYPDVKVGLEGGRMGETGAAIIGLRFSLPLPVIDRSRGRQEEAQANVGVAEAELEAARLDLEREWAHAQQRYRTAAEQVASYRDRLLPKAEEALTLVRRGFEEGKFGFIDLLDTQRTAAEAQLAFQQKLLEMNLAQVELEALLFPQASTSPAGKP